MKKISIILLFLILWLGCDDGSFVPTGMDCQETPTYDGIMKDLIDRNCSYTGCHTIGANIGDYTTYNGMRVHFAGSILDRVVNLVDDTVLGMPPDNAQGPKNLSEEDFMLFNCWISEEFPEN